MTADFPRRLASFDSAAYPTLRPAQDHVLGVYAAEHRDTADVAIELPTGVGKTLIALLICDLALDEGRSVAYLTGTNQLSEQVAHEAERLGLAIHMFRGGHYPPADLDDYHNAQAAGLMNYWVYFNSRPNVAPADVVIFDDAHLAEQPITGLFALEIPRAEVPDLYDGVCELILAHSDAYLTLRSMQEGGAPPGTPPELISFNDWMAVAPATSELIGESDLVRAGRGRFVWPGLRSRLESCGVLIGPSVIEIRPYHPPTSVWPGYRDAQQRIYLSATLGSIDDLQRRLGAGHIASIETPRELHLNTTGRRLFLLNPSVETTLSASNFDFVLSQAEVVGRVAWLCSSHAEADEVEAILSGGHVATYRLRPGDDSALERWATSPNGHLVAAGRYDGLDFEGDTCRLVAIVGIPAASSEFERFVMAYLGDAAFMRHRVGQRITQALGRANRTVEDWALYYGLDPSFGSMLAQPTVRGSLGADVVGLVRHALELQQQGWGPITEAADAFFRGAEVDAAPTPRRRPGRDTDRTRAAHSAAYEVDAATSMWLGDYPRAATAANSAAESLIASGETEHAAFWRYIAAHANFAEGTAGSMEQAVDALRGAIEGGPRTAWFVRLRHTLAELQGRRLPEAPQDELFRAWDEWLRTQPNAARTLDRTRTQLTGSHDEQVAGVLLLGRLAGAFADRPTGASATDARWVWLTPQRAEKRLWEVKTGESAERVPRRDINQVLGQLTVEATEARAARTFACLLTPLQEMEADAAAAARDQVAVLNVEAVTYLFDYLADRFRRYAREWGTGTAAERGAAREVVEASLPPGGWLARVLSPSQGTVRRRTDVERLLLG